MNMHKFVSFLWSIHCMSFILWLNKLCIRVPTYVLRNPSVSMKTSHKQLISTTPCLRVSATLSGFGSFSLCPWNAAWEYKCGGLPPWAERTVFVLIHPAPCRHVLSISGPFAWWYRTCSAVRSAQVVNCTSTSTSTLQYYTLVLVLVCISNGSLRLTIS